MLVTIFTSLNNRFNQSSLIFRKISNPYYWKKSKVKTLLMSQGIKGIYNDEINITQFEIEADVLRVIFYEKIVDCFDSFLSEIWKLSREQRLLLPCTVDIYKHLLVNPATTSAAEQSFSTVKRMKTWMRSKMIPVKFNALPILHTHNNLTDNLNLKDVANIFYEKSERRQLIFDRF